MGGAHIEQEWAKKLASFLSELEQYTDESLVPVSDAGNRASFFNAFEDAKPYLRKMSEMLIPVLSGHNDANGGWYHNHSLK